MKARTRRKANGQYRRSFWSHLKPLVFLLAFTFLMWCIQQYFKEQELLNPCEPECKFEFQVRAFEPVIVEPQPEIKTGIATAYSCIGITDKYHLEMNCPSLKYYKNGRTSNGTEPVPYRTMACDKANMGRKFMIEGFDEPFTCTDTGGAIKGSGRFDLYFGSINEAYKWGKQEVRYWEVK
jgi:3D (Asp-Asp-Asp) domain-containing protein